MWRMQLYGADPPVSRVNQTVCVQRTHTMCFSWPAFTTTAQHVHITASARNTCVCMHTPGHSDTVRTVRGTGPRLGGVPLKALIQ